MMQAITAPPPPAAALPPPPAALPPARTRTTTTHLPAYNAMLCRARLIFYSVVELRSAMVVVATKQRTEF